MMQIICEGMKPSYQALVEAIMGTKADSDEREQALGALDHLTGIVLACNSSYEGMPMPEMATWMHNDFRFVRGQMTAEEEEQHIRHHWELIESIDKELQELMKQQREEKR